MEPGLLGSAGNFLLQANAFGDPLQTFRNNAPRGLIDQYDEEEQRRMGEQLQDQFRSLRSRSDIRNRFEEGLTSEAAAEQAAAKQQQFGGLLSNLVNENRLDMARARAFNQLGPEEGLKRLTEQFTLTPGDFRGDVTGPINAQPTQDVQEFNVAKQDGSFEGGFTDFQDRNERTNVSAGQAVIGPDGRLIFQQPTTDQQNRDAGIQSGDGPSVRDQKIADLQRLNPGLSDAEVVGLVDGTISVRQDPDTGRNFIVNAANGQQKPVKTVGTGEGSGDQPANTSVSPGVDVQDTTGIGGALRRSVNAISDIIGFGAAAPGTDKATTELNNFNQLAKLKIADNVTDGRRSNMLIEMLDSLTADPASIFQGSENARNRLDALDRLLAQEIQNKRIILDNEFDNRPADVQKARRSISSLEGLRGDLDILIGGFGKEGARPDQGDIGSPPQSSGVTPEEWQYLNEEERQQLNDAFGAGQ